MDIKLITKKNHTSKSLQLLSKWQIKMNLKIYLIPLTWIWLLHDTIATVWRWVQFSKLQNVRPTVHDVEKQLLNVGFQWFVLLNKLSVLVFKIYRCVWVWIWENKIMLWGCMWIGLLLVWVYVCVCVCMCSLMHTHNIFTIKSHHWGMNMCTNII